MKSAWIAIVLLLGESLAIMGTLYSWLGEGMGDPRSQNQEEPHLLTASGKQETGCPGLKYPWSFLNPSPAHLLLEKGALERCRSWGLCGCQVAHQSFRLGLLFFLGGPFAEAFGCATCTWPHGLYWRSSAVCTWQKAQRSAARCKRNFLLVSI